MTAPYTVPQEVVEATKRTHGVSPIEIALFGALGASTAADMATTFHGIKKGSLVEANPVMRPFVKAGPLPTGLVQGAIGLGVSALSRHLKKKKIPAWWVPVVAHTVGHSLAAVHNAKLK